MADVIRKALGLGLAVLVAAGYVLAIEDGTAGSPGATRAGIVAAVGR